MQAQESPRRWRALALLSAAELAGMSLWLSASASVPALRVEWNLDYTGATWLTLAVQLGGSRLDINFQAQATRVLSPKSSVNAYRQPFKSSAVAKNRGGRRCLVACS